MKRVQEGDVVKVEGVEYRFGPTSTEAFNDLAELREDGWGGDVELSIRRLNDSRPTLFLFSQLQEVVEAS